MSDDFEEKQKAYQIRRRNHTTAYCIYQAVEGTKGLIKQFDRDILWNDEEMPKVVAIKKHAIDALAILMKVERYLDETIDNLYDKRGKGTGRMRDLTELKQYAIEIENVIIGYGGGAYQFTSPIDGQPLIVIASNGGGWDHVSVSRRNRCPNWFEMEYIAERFFKENEYAIQYHVPKSDHINIHPYTLHWWRPQELELLLPPKIMV
jgi:hypothetical protein